MKDLTYNKRIAIMRILYDIIIADNKIDKREKILFGEVAKELGLDSSAKEDVIQTNSLLALVIINDFTQQQKERLAQIMGQMIIIDEDINYNELKIYNVVNEFCKINVEFDMERYPEYTRS